MEQGADVTAAAERDLSADGEAFARDIYRVHSRHLLALVMRLTGDPWEAEEVVQETMARAWRNANRLTGEQGPVWGWLSRVARNIVVDRVRARRARPIEVELVGDELPSLQVADPVDALVRSVVIAEAVSRLGPPYRAAVAQVYLLDRSAAQAAAALGVPVGTVKSRLHQARPALAVRLAELRSPP